MKGISRVNSKLSFIYDSSIRLTFYCFLIAFTLLKFSIVSAQDKDIQFEHLSMKDGLSMNPVMAIIQDHEGYLWFGTQDGLNKYDGYGFVVYKSDDQDSLSLSDNFITSLADDANGNLWVGTLSGGLNCLEPRLGKFTRYSAAFVLPGNRIYALFKDHQQRLWIGTENGPAILDLKTRKIIRASAAYKTLSVLDNLNILALLEDRSGKFWIGTTSGVFRFDPSKGEVQRFYSNAAPGSLPNDIVLTLFQDSKDNIWVGTVDGLSRYQNGSFKSSYFKEKIKAKKGVEQTTVDNIYSVVNNYGGNTIRCMLEDANGKFWIGTDMELIIYDPVSGTFVNYKKDLINPMGINDHFIRSMFVDRSMNLWIGTLGNGLNKVNLKPKKFQHYQKNLSGSSLSENYVRAICEDREGRIYVGTLVGGLNVFDPDKNKFIHIPKTAENSSSSINDDNVWSLLCDKNGYVWIGTNNGLDRFDPSTGMYRHYQHDPSNLSSISENTIRCVYEDLNGTIWVGTEGGLNRYSREKDAFVRITRSTGLSDNSVWKVHMDRAGYMWAATNDGLNRIDQNNKIRIYRKVNNDIASLSHNGVRTIFEDEDGYIWVGTQNGLNRYDHKTDSFMRYFEADGLPNSFIYGIVADGKGNLWISTNKGISRRDKVTGSFTNYDVFDGLQDYEFNTNACFRTQKGEIYFGGPSGLNRFDPLAMPVNRFVAPVVITSVKVFDKKFKTVPDEKGEHYLELNYDQNILTFDFASLDYTYPSRNRYEYKMEGFNGEYIQAGNNRFTSYTNLDPGEYVFKVRGTNSDGVWSDKVASIRVIIHPPFWKTKWFYALCILAAFALAALIFRMRLRALQKEKKILEEKVNERTFALEAEKRKVEDANAELEKLSIVARETDNAVIIADGSGEIEWVNLGFERLHGTLEKYRQNVGTSIFTTSSNEHLREVFNRSVKENRSFNYESVSENERGERSFLQSTLTPILDDNGNVKKIVVIDADITERKMAEQIITQKNKDITDSINYAKRIQQAILPDQREFHEQLNDAFILYLPKDIVSGDFYWFTKIVDGSSSYMLVAAADCTGHGVPGAFMSMIGNAVLNEVVKEKKQTDPATILSMLDLGIRTALKQEMTGSDSMDGMDIALCRIDLTSRRICYAGAMRPMYIIRKDALVEYKADKTPIGGKNELRKSFSNNEVDLQCGDRVYIFTDGYPDQFSGVTGKKMMTRNFKDLLVRIHKLPMNEQKEALMTWFYDWKGTADQVDDVLVIGAAF